MKGNFLRNTSIVGAMTLLSRVTGMLRDMVYSRMFGAGVLMDAFLVAFKIPNFMRRLFAEGAFSQAFVPVVSEYKVQRTHEEVRELGAPPSKLEPGICRPLSSTRLKSGPTPRTVKVRPGDTLSSIAADVKRTVGQILTAIGVMLQRSEKRFSAADLRALALARMVAARGQIYTALCSYAPDDLLF